MARGILPLGPFVCVCVCDGCLFIHNVLAQRNPFLRPGLFQNKETIIANACKNRMF